MSDAIKKLIESGKWQPIDDAPYDDILVKGGNVVGEINNVMHKCDCSVVRNKDYGSPDCRDVDSYSVWIDGATHFRPLPDDRLANALQVAVEALKAASNTCANAFLEIKTIAEKTNE
jgi:hypothetical protein